MNILVTGNMGYVGPIVVRRLRLAFPGARLSGLDAGYFAHCLTSADYLPERDLDIQYFGDVRNPPPQVLQDVDAVVHLAAISNDPMGKSFEEVTASINHRASVALAQAAKQAGVRSFVFASSCSIYGVADDSPRTETSALNPLTAYSRSKVATEDGLRELAGPDFRVTCLRFATACGMSPRLRLDLVVNDFVACALASKRIDILSDGTPWRPLIHVADMARAFEWGLQRERDAGGDFLAVNVGSSAWNYQVKGLADAVASVMPEVEISINRAAPVDSRSYRVDFSLFEKLAPQHQPQVDLASAIRELKAGLEASRFSNANFRTSQYMRLEVLRTLIGKGLLDQGLAWQSGAATPASS